MTIHSDSARFSRALRSAILWPAGAIFVTALLLLLLTFLLFWMVGWSDHSYQVIEQTRKCENLVLRLQTNLRGYFLTEDPLFLESYQTGEPEADLALQDLRKLVMDKPMQVKQTDNIIEAKNTWTQYSATLLARARNAPVNGDWTKVEQTLMSVVQAKFDRFREVENGLHEGRLKSVRRMKQLLCYAGGSLALLLALTVGQLVRRQFMNLAADHRKALEDVEQRHLALARSEADLEEQKEWFRVTLSSIGDGVIVTDREGRLVFMNHEAERLTGWTSVEALLKPLPTVFKIIHEETRAAVEDPVAGVFREKKAIGLAQPCLLLSRAGHEWPVGDSAAPICDPKGTILGVVMVFHDATEMRRAQNALKAHSAELEKKVAERTITLRQAMAELEMFSYTVSHDLRSPLRAMQGFAEAVREDYGDKLDERGKNYLERIKHAGERLDRLIKDLHSYARISRQDEPLVALDLDRVLREIIENDSNLQSPAAGVRVEGTFPRILGREANLFQVLTNLLGNAVKFVPSGTPPQIRIWSEERGPRLRLWIEDNGIGIAPGDQERIFGMFAQLNESPLYGGTGVGLAIVRKAAETMHGSVGVESEKGKGSRFWVELTRASS